MLSKDIVIGQPYMVQNRVSIVIDKGKFERAFFDGREFTLDIGDGAYTETLRNYWYRQVDDKTARVVVWPLRTSRIEVVQPRQVDYLVPSDKFTAQVAEYASGSDLQRIETEEHQRLQDAQRRVAEIISTVLGRDPGSLSQWDINDPWRMVTEDKEFSKKTFMLYLKVMASKGEQIEGWNTEDLIDDVRVHAQAARETHQRRLARRTAAMSSTGKSLETNHRIRVFEPEPELEQVNG